MKIRLALGLLALSPLAACGKKEPAPAPVAAAPAPANPAPAEAAPAPADKPAEAAPAPADKPAEAAPADKPAEAAPAPADKPAEAAGHAEKPAETLAQKTGLPGWFAPLFVEGHVMTFDMKEKLTISEMAEDDPSDLKTTEKQLTGTYTCTVKSVTTTGDKRRSEVECTGHDSEAGLDAALSGKWVTDGRSLWETFSDGHEELRFEHPPTAKKTGDEDTETMEWKENPERPGMWCFTHGFHMGDGGGYSICFIESEGPMYFDLVGGSATTTAEIEATLKK